MRKRSREGQVRGDDLPAVLGVLAEDNSRARMEPGRGGATRATAFARQGDTERRKEKTDRLGWWAGRKGQEELQEPPASERGCKSAAAAWMSLLSLCDRMCGTAAWLVPFTCLRGVRFLSLSLSHDSLSFRVVPFRSAGRNNAAGVSGSGCEVC